MSFWKFKSAFAPPPTEGIDAILAGLPSSDSINLVDSSTSTSSSTSSTTHFQNATRTSNEIDPTPYRTALDLLLVEPDLLNEIKGGSNQTLNDFLARKEVVLRLGGWVVWGLGRGMEFKVNHLNNDRDEGSLSTGKSGTVRGNDSVAMNRKGSLLETGVLPDDLEDGKVPDEVVKAEAERERVGMGGTPRRKEVDLEGLDDDETGGEGEESRPNGRNAENDDEQKWENFPRICTEILAGSPPSLSDILFEHEAASSQPHLCPSPAAFLLPFWESVLGSTEQQLAVRASQVGFWARINSVLLDGPFGRRVVDQILQIPHLLPRLLSLLPFCSPINDLLLVLLRVSRPPSPLIPSAVTQSIRMLDPFSALGKPGHVAAEELLRGIIESCSAVPKPQLGGIGPGGGAGGGAGGGGGMIGLGQAGSDEQAFDWRDTTLARQIAEERTVKLLLDWMLAEVNEHEEEDDEDEKRGEESDTVKEGSETNGEVDETIRRRELRTSSLIASVAVLVDLIRKNNSDFVEQQMLAWARRKEAEVLEKEMLDDERGTSAQDSSEERDRDLSEDRGPSVVDLRAMLTVISDRIGGLQALLRKPRSSTAPVKTAAGPLSPLTLERLRICELYAELLHCSNMSLLNQPERSLTLYDSNGYLASGYRAADELAQALAGPPPPPEEASQDFGADSTVNLPSSPSINAVKSPYSTSPGDHSLLSTSGISTPSGRESLDEESGGVLTKSEAKALKQIVDLANLNSELEEAGGPAEEEVRAREELGREGDDDGDSIETERRRQSTVSNGTIGSAELPATPSIYSTSSRQLPATPLAPGPLLKTRFMQHGVVNTMLDLFFDFPWNNFLHNVVFDIIQQIFHGRIDRQLDRQLALSLFLDGRLCERLLDGKRRNEEAAAKRVNMRLGYMGHLSLITDETVKFFDRYPEEIFSVVESSIPQPQWNEFIDSTLRDIRERDSAPLAGSAPLQLSALEQTNSSGFDDDDEFPMNSSRTMRATEAGDAAEKAGDTGDNSLTDQFSRYLANAISNDRTDKFGSSDEDDEDDANWLGGGRFDSGDVDFAIDAESSSSRQPRSFGFDDRFDEAGATAFRSAGSDSDEEWAPFEGSANNDNGLAADPFTPTVASTSTSMGFDNSFGGDFGSESISTTTPQDDDWGDFEAGENGDNDGFSGPSTFGIGPSISIPPMDAFDDFDFGESSRPSISLPPPSPSPQEGGSTTAFDFARPSFGRQETSEADQDGSAMFGRLSIGSSAPASPAGSIENPLPPLDGAVAESRREDEEADRATDEQEPLGPSMHSNAHVTEDGFVEAEVDGRIIKVPADDIIVAHRRRSSRSSSLSSDQAPASEERQTPSSPPATSTEENPTPSSTVEEAATTIPEDDNEAPSTSS